MPVSGPLSLLGAGDACVLMSTGEQGVPMLKSLYSVGGTHAQLPVPIKCRRCPCPHPHFESGGVLVPIRGRSGSVPALPPVLPAEMVPAGRGQCRFSGTSKARAARGWHGDRPAADESPGPPGSHLGRGGTLCLRPTGDGGDKWGDTAPRHTGERSRAQPRCPRTDPPTRDAWGSNRSADRNRRPRGALRPEWCSPPAAPCPPLPAPVPVPTPLT